MAALPSDRDVAIRFGADSILRYIDETYALGVPLPINAPVPEPNLGDTRTSWLSTFISFEQT